LTDICHKDILKRNGRQVFSKGIKMTKRPKFYDHKSEDIIAALEKTVKWLEHHISILGLNEHGIKFGKYKLSYYSNGDLWLDELGGEGQKVDPEKLEKVIEKYYEENF
jgi:hypothetical protein